MTSCSNILEVRRCRPLLGTFVEITAQGNEVDQLDSAIRAAFDAMEQIQILMSSHNSESELSHLNANAFKHPVKLSDDTFEVIQRGLTLARQSQGAFDFTVGHLMANWGYLPKTRRLCPESNWHDVQLLPNNRVRFLRPLSVDLGGIAKGYAVDRAVDVLRNHEVKSAVVNAGGDLRVFGSKSIHAYIRHPVNPQQLIHPIELHEAALATSAPYFTRRLHHDRIVSHLIEPLEDEPVVGCISVSVRAAECWIADALTKAVLNLKQQATPILAQYGAEAFVISV